MACSEQQKKASAKRRESNRARAKRRTHKRVRARAVLPGQSLKITLRCHESRLLLATGGDPELVRETFAYLLGIALEKYGVLFHAGIQMGNHHHLDATDARGVRPHFKAFFHGLVARAINCARGRSGDFWDRRGSCDTIRDNDEDSIGDLVYTETNAVTAGLVKWPERWPGFHSAGWAFGEVRTFHRPALAIFDLDTERWPPKVEIKRVKPPCLRNYTDAEATLELQDRVRLRCIDKQAELAEQNRRFKGPGKLRKDKWWRSPGGSKDRYRVAPKVAVRSRWRKLAMLQRDREWEAAYAKADEAFQGGDRDVVFPAGTWKLRVDNGVNVAPPAS